MRAISQITIYSLNDVVTSAIAPENPYFGQLWVDTSVSPPKTKVWTGSIWKEQNGTDDLRSSVQTLTTKEATLETNLDGLTSNVSTLIQEVDANTSDITIISQDVSTLQQTATSLTAEVSNKADKSYGSASSTFGWSLTSSGFYLYSNATTVMSVTSSGLTVNGTITASSGTIGGFTIGSSAIYKTKTSYSSSTAGVYLGTTGIGLGAGTFYVNSAGYLVAKSGTIGAWSISSSNIYSSMSGGSFYIASASNSSPYWIRAYTGAGATGTMTFSVSKAGVLEATGATISGTITASSGTIGGFTIGSNAIYKTKAAYNNTTEGVYVGTDGIGLGAGTFYVTSSGYLYATVGKIGGMSLSSSQMYSQNFILGTVYNSEDQTQSFTTLSFGTTSGSTFTATTVITNSGSYFQAMSANYISAGMLTVSAVKADPGISSTTGFYFGLSGGSTQYYAELSWSGAIIYLKIYNGSGVLTTLTSSKTFTVHYACIWGGDTTWNATVSAGSNSTSINTNAFWGIDYATFNYSSSNKSQHTYYFTVSGSSAASTITSWGHIVPYYNNNYDLGSPAFKWNNIYGQAGIVNTSDRNEKQNIVPMSEVYDRIFDSLVPVTFTYIVNTSNRTHVGLIAQDVKAAIENAGLTTKDFAGYCEWEYEDKTVGCGLRYGEFVAINIYEIQKLKARICELESKIKTMEEGNNEA